MRSMLQGRAGMGLAFILGLLIATAGTATAAKLITGKQIKDGSISSKDLSKVVRNQLSRTGAAGVSGPQGSVGPKGDQGPAGPVLTVKDATGAVVGPLVSQSATSFLVLRDGGLYGYEPSGLLNRSGFASFVTSNCLGTAYQTANGYGSEEQAGQTFGDRYRNVYRTILAGGVGPPRAWKGSGVAAAYVNQSMYYVNPATEVCTANGTYTGILVRLDSVTPPPDFTGPLTAD